MKIKMKHTFALFFATKKPYATKEPYNALVIDATRGKPIFKKNFDKVLNIS